MSWSLFTLDFCSLCSPRERSRSSVIRLKMVGCTYSSWSPLDTGRVVNCACRIAPRFELAAGFGDAVNERDRASKPGLEQGLAISSAACDQAAAVAGLLVALMRPGGVVTMVLRLTSDAAPGVADLESPRLPIIIWPFRSSATARIARILVVEPMNGLALTSLSRTLHACVNFLSSMPSILSRNATSFFSGPVSAFKPDCCFLKGSPAYISRGINMSAHRAKIQTL